MTNFATDDPYDRPAIAGGCVPATLLAELRHAARRRGVVLPVHRRRPRFAFILGLTTVIDLIAFWFYVVV